jgi:hypothetical protein
MFQAGAVPEDFLGESNIVDRISVPSLSYEGKVWTIVLNGEKKRLERKNADGDMEPVSIMRVIILDYAKNDGRAFYEGTYDPKKPGKPTCWSDDGNAPDASIQEPQSSRCNTCPQSVKGSKITDNGVETTACSRHRMIVVVPASDPSFPPLRLKLAATSIYGDKDQKDWFAFNNYVNFLRSKGVTHTARVATKMKFDATPYPKVLFSAHDWVAGDDIQKVKDVWASPEVKSLIDGTWTPDGVNGQRKLSSPKDEPADEDASTKATEAKAAAEAKAAEDKAIAAAAKAKAEKAEKAEKAKAAKAAKDAEEKAAAEKAAAEEAAAKKAAAPKEAPAEDADDIPDDVKDLLTEWGSE